MSFVHQSTLAGARISRRISLLLLLVVAAAAGTLVLVADESSFGIKDRAVDASAPFSRGVPALSIPERRTGPTALSAVVALRPGDAKSIYELRTGPAASR